MILFALAAAWQPPPCPDADPRECAARDLMIAEQVMDAEYGHALSRVANCRPVNSTRCDNRPRAREVVRAEQEAWLAWRNAHCDVMAFSMEATSAEGQVRADCRTGLTVERTDELKKIGSDPEPGE